MSDLKITQYGTGVAEPQDINDMFPAALDKALGAESARKKWEATTVTGMAAQAAYVAAGALFRSERPESGYADRTAWNFAATTATAELSDAVKVATRNSILALQAYDDAQRTGAHAPGVKAKFADAYLDADKRARLALTALTEAFTEREGLMRYLVKPEQSATIGRGHWMNSYTLAGRLNQQATYQFNDLETIVMVAPRDLVKSLLK